MKNSNMPKGSFGIPEEMRKAINEIERKKKEPEQKEQVVNDVEEMFEKSAYKEPELPAESKPNVTEDPAKKRAELLAEVRKDLGIEISEDDLWSFLYSNEIIKRNVVIVPQKMHATFRTISLNDTNKIDSNMASILEEKRLESGFKNINTQHILSYGLVELGRPGMLKSIGETPEERFATIGKMSALLVEKLGRKWNEFVFLVDESVKQEMESKKD